MIIIDNKLSSVNKKLTEFVTTDKRQADKIK